MNLQINSTTNTSKIYFEHFDVIRFVAAFMIIILHAYEAWWGWFGPIDSLCDKDKKLSYFGEYINQFINNLGIGVDIFFLLSGFLITYILLEEKKRFKTIQIGKFMIRRIFRIWPLYFLIIAISPFLINWLDSNQPNYFANLLMIGNFDIIKSETWTFPFAHLWSICVEEHFYLVWPFIIYFVPTKRLLPVFGLLIFSSIFFRIWIYSSMELPWYTLYLHSICRMDVLIIGAIGAYFYSKNPFTIQLPNLIRILLYLIFILILSIEPDSMWNSMFLAGFKKFLIIGVISVILLDYNFNPNYNHFFTKLKFIKYLGKISYGIYMYGNILLLVIIKQIMWRFHITNMWIFFLFVLFLSIVIPIISYELFEKHFLKLNKYFRVLETKR